MTNKEKQVVNNIVELEGFDYGLTNWSLEEGSLETHAAVRDKKYHELRKKWVDARKALIDYAGIEE